MDNISKIQRSFLMSRIRSKNTAPELAVRRVLHSLGYRFKLHDPSLPGRPDIVLPRHQIVVEVRGCFWHGHNCTYARPPRTHTRYWLPKLRETKKRDARNASRLRRAGWVVVIIWECSLKGRLAVETSRLVQSLMSAAIARRERRFTRSNGK